MTSSLATFLYLPHTQVLRVISELSLSLLQKYETGRNDIGQVNVFFSKTDSSIAININNTQSLLTDIEQEQNEDEDEKDSLTSQDMMSFSWQIAQGMVSEKYQL